MGWLDTTDAYEMFKFIAPDQKLGVAIAATCALQVLPVYEKLYPNDPRPREALELSLHHLLGYPVTAKAHRSGRYLVADSAFAASEESRGIASKAASAAAYLLYAINSTGTKACNIYNAYVVQLSIETGYNTAELIRNLIPQCIDYAIQHQIKLFCGHRIEIRPHSKFTFEEILDSLDVSYRTKVLFHLNLFIGN